MDWHVTAILWEVVFRGHKQLNVKLQGPIDFGRNPEMNDALNSLKQEFFQETGLRKFTRFLPEQREVCDEFLVARIHVSGRTSQVRFSTLQEVKALDLAWKKKWEERKAQRRDGYHDVGETPVTKR